ncbi:MAG TPA: hypothetical protein VF534_21255 [Paraburkholderia sp.]
MTHLAFELFSDINAAHPYITVYLLDDGESYNPSKFSPFMELAVEKDSNLVLTVYETDTALSLSVDQWEEIARRARKYHAEILASGEDW